MDKKKLRRRAQLECANWNTGDCLGCDFNIDKEYLKKNNWVPVFQYLDSGKAGKPCVVEEGCKYFDRFVVQ